MGSSREHHDLQFLELAGTKPQDDELQNALKPDVADEKEHDASEGEVEKRRYFIQNRISAPYRFGGVLNFYYREAA